MRLTIKDYIRESRMFNERAVISLVIVGLLIAAIVVRLVYLQIISHEYFATLSNDNRVTINPRPPTRGLIYDRNGVLLAQNLPSFSLEFIPERIPDIAATIKGISKIITITDDDVERFYEQLNQQRSFMSIPLRFQLNEEEVARFAVNRHLFNGVDIEARLIRNYPHGSLAAHTVGYVGRINVKELQKLDPTNYSATRFIGKTGAEKYYEDRLHGIVGYDHIETNALGRTLRTLKRIPPQPGDNLYLTLDARLQQTAEEALAGKRGAAVAIDPNTGDILALASMPSFDPNLFVTGIDSVTYQGLQKSLDKPLFNRTLQGQYSPGSTVKPFLGLAGLEYEYNKTMAPVMCIGWYTLEGDDHRYRDWKRGGHGSTSLNKAITQSCDVYFYNLALQLGIDRMHTFLSQFGFGLRTHVDLPGESAGLLPSREWKRKKYHQPWYPGETLITGIGQGYTLVTPMQLAEATAMMAMKGKHMQPRLMFAYQKSGSDKVTLLPPVEDEPVTLKHNGNWDQIIQAMKNVVHGLHGTATGIGHNLPFKIAGKTGTAQVFGIKQDEKYVKEDVAARLRDHSLFIAFAPADKPEIAIAVVVENGGGNHAASPIARKLIDQYLLDKGS